MERRYVLFGGQCRYYDCPHAGVLKINFLTFVVSGLPYYQSAKYRQPRKKYYRLLISQNPDALLLYFVVQLRSQCWWKLGMREMADKIMKP